MPKKHQYTDARLDDEIRCLWDAVDRLNQLVRQLSLRPPVHDHTDNKQGGELPAAAIASGTIDTARLGSGTADVTKVLHGDSTWAVP